MFDTKFGFIIIFLVFVFAVTFSQVQEGTPCETPNQDYGVCNNIYNCELLLNLLQTQSSNEQVRTYLRRSTCGYMGRVPMVCCPQQRPRSQDSLPEDPNELTRNPSSTALPLLRPPNCGVSNNTDPRVVGGFPATLGQFPWMVVLGYRNSKNPNQPRWLCGGTLISEKHILTAGHCVHNRNDLYLARIGELDLYDDNDGANPEDVELVKAKIHEDYNPVEHTNDIAILTMSKAIDIGKIKPICLPVDEPLRSSNFVGKKEIVAGWGALYFNGPSSSLLQVVQLPVLDNANCKRAFGDRAVIDERIICAGYLTGGKDSCKGDSGGPLMHGVAEGRTLRFYQTGVVSYGFKCAEAGYPGVYTRVTNFVDWIKRNLV